VPGEAVGGVVEREKILDRRRGRVRDPVEVDAILPAAALQAAPAAGVVDEDQSHRLGGGEEVGPAFEPPVADEAQVGLAHQRDGIEGVIVPFVGHPGGREPAQLVVDERERVSGSRALSGGGVQESRASNI
jgi:hypothetical protein